MSGTVGILNVGAGDTKLVFDKSDPAECIRAARIVKDMLKRGYALMVQVPGSDPPTYRRAYEFNENTCEYVIADFDPVTADERDKKETRDEQAAQASTDQSNAKGREKAEPRPRRGRTRSVHASDTRVVAVARSAGG